MSRQLTGTLDYPDGDPIGSLSVKLKAKQVTAPNIPKGVSDTFSTDASGSYDVTIEDGYYEVYVKYNTSYEYIGDIIVEVAAATDILSLIAATSNLTPPSGIGVLTTAQATDLTDGGDSTLHYHATDRDRANHTGTQTLSTISDAGDSAGLNVGASAGTVAAGDDSRFLSSAEKTDLTDGNDSTAHYHATDRDRANHTGQQAMSTISDAGGSATLDVGTTSGTVAAGDDSRFTDTDLINSTPTATTVIDGVVYRTANDSSDYVINLDYTKSVMILVADAAGVTGWDVNGNSISELTIVQANISSIAALDGEIWIGHSGGVGRYRVEQDGATLIKAISTTSTPALVGNAVNKVSLAILPGYNDVVADIFTNDGTTRIAGDVAIDMVDTAADDHSNGVILDSFDSLALNATTGKIDVYNADTNADTNTPDQQYTTTETLLEAVDSGDKVCKYDGGFALGQDGQLTLVNRDRNCDTNISSTYITGWKPSGCLAAFCIENTEGATLTSPSTLPDKSVKGNAITVTTAGTGALTNAAVATGAELTAISGFFYTDASNYAYLEQSYNADLDFGTGYFYVIGGFKFLNNTGVEVIIDRRKTDDTGGNFRVLALANGTLLATDGTTAIVSSSAYDDGVWHQFVWVRGCLYVDGQLVASGNQTADVSNAEAVLTIGIRASKNSPFSGSLALIRIGSGAPTAEDVEYIYNTEKELFKDNAVYSLGADACTAMAWDDLKKELYYGSSAGIDKYSGLVNQGLDTTTTSPTAISVDNGIKFEGK